MSEQPTEADALRNAKQAELMTIEALKSLLRYHETLLEGLTKRLDEISPAVNS